MHEHPTIIRTTLRDTRELLTSPLLTTAFKIDQFFEIWEIIYPGQLDSLKAQYKDWLLYSDGEKHARLRADAAKIALGMKGNENAYNRIFQSFLDTSSKKGEILLSDITFLSRRIHREFLFLTDSQYTQIFQPCYRIGKFITAGELDVGITPVLLNSLIPRLSVYFSQLPKSSLIGKLRDANLPLGTIINLVGDTFSPLQSVLSSCSRSIVENEELFQSLSPDLLPAFVSEVLRLYTPFRFCTRIQPEPHNAEGKIAVKRIRIDIAKANLDEDEFADTQAFKVRSPNNHASFGHGRHSCLGSTFVTNILCLYAGMIRESGLLRNARVKRLNASDKGGIYKYQRLQISLR
jgi:hypothetical protein